MTLRDHYTPGSQWITSIAHPTNPSLVLIWGYFSPEEPDLPWKNKLSFHLPYFSEREIRGVALSPSHWIFSQTIKSSLDQKHTPTATQQLNSYGIPQERNTYKFHALFYWILDAIYKTFSVVRTEVSSFLIPVRLGIEVRIALLKAVETKILPSMQGSKTSLRNPRESMTSSILIKIIQRRLMCLVV